MISIYKKCLKHNIRGQQPLSYPFTQIIIFNLHFCTLETLKQDVVTPLGRDFYTFQVVGGESGGRWGS